MENNICTCNEFCTLPDYGILCNVIKSVDPTHKPAGMYHSMMEWSRTHSDILIDLYNCTKNWITVFDAAHDAMWCVDTLVRLYNIPIFEIINIYQYIDIVVLAGLMSSMRWEDAVMLMSR
jgi:hypothetical protein